MIIHSTEPKAFEDLLLVQPFRFLAAVVHHTGVRMKEYVLRNLREFRRQVGNGCRDSAWNWNWSGLCRCWSCCRVHLEEVEHPKKFWVKHIKVTLFGSHHFAFTQSKRSSFINFEVVRVACLHRFFCVSRCKHDYKSSRLQNFKPRWCGNFPEIEIPSQFFSEKWPFSPFYMAHSVRFWSINPSRQWHLIY